MILLPSSSSSFGGGGGPRRPAVNIISPSHQQPPLDQSKYCPRCSLQLSYMQDLDLWYCKKCGWNIPKELLNPPPAQQQNKKQTQGETSSMPALTGTRNEISSSTTQEEDIAIASKGIRASERKKDPFSYLRKEDDAWLEEKKGMTLVSDRIDLPTGGDNKEVLSSEDLKRERERRTKGRW
jgi:ribosomal protein L37AE/L43A